MLIAFRNVCSPEVQYGVNYTQNKYYIYIERVIILDISNQNDMQKGEIC